MDFCGYSVYYPFSVRLVPGCDSDGPCLCVDLSDKEGLARLQAILAGGEDNVFPQFTVAELESRGILKGILFS